jgi:hypothetical protein
MVKRRKLKVGLHTHISALEGSAAGLFQEMFVPF